MPAFLSMVFVFSRNKQFRTFWKKVSQQIDFNFWTR